MKRDGAEHVINSSRSLSSTILGSGSNISGRIRNFRYDAIEESFFDVVAPLFGTVEITSSCNLSCSHCYHGELLNNVQKNRWLTLGDYKRIFAELSELGTIVLSFTGGEPFLRDDFEEILKISSRHNFLLQVFTNATLFDSDKQEMCEYYGVDKVQISIYSTDMQRRPSSDRIALALNHAESAANRSFSVVGVLTPTNTNDKFISIVAQRWGEIGIPFSFNTYIRPTDLGGDHNRDEYRANPFRLSSVSKYENCELTPVRNTIDIRPCNAGHNVFALKCDGQFLPCIAWPESAGNVSSSSIGELFYSELFDRMRKTTISKFRQCKTCEYVLECGICPGANFSASRDSTIPDPGTCSLTIARMGIGSLDK